ncbi:MAG: fused MFS/spermidine synthase [Steroidobacteraceae bacterium]
MSKAARKTAAPSQPYNKHFIGLCLCFTLSGVAALIYQTAWTRQFALVFGTSELAVATVLAAYMGGLALGARLAALYLPRIRRPVRWYALLELGIGAAAALLVPAGLWLAERLLVSWFGNQPAPPDSALSGSTWFYLVAAFVILMIPTTLMGATLPLLVRDGVQSDAQIGARTGLLYACNTAGAVAGALLCALLLLPALGLSGTVWSAAAVNLLVGVVALVLLQTPAAATPTDNAAVSGTEFSAAGGASNTALAASTPPRWARGADWVLPLLLLSGAVSFVHEVLWTRLLQRVVGGSVHAFGIMVASFLLGIALGGALGARLARDRQRAVQALVLSQLGIALGAVLAWYAVDELAALLTTQWQREGFGLVVLLPLTFAIGLTYPLAVRVLARGVADASSAAARVYSWNTLGAIAGALLGGFLLIPALRYEGTIRLLVLLSTLLALGSALLLLPLRRAWLVAPAVAVLGAALFHPGVPDRLLRVSPLRSGVGEMVYYGVGRSADVVAMVDDGLIGLRTNGLPEAAIVVHGGLAPSSVEAWMSALAVVSRPDTAHMLVVGFGGGNVLQAVPQSVRNVDVIELEPEVIAANRRIATLRNSDPLSDSRVHLIQNDARGALSLTDARYDAIVSQPSHPWTAGASHLYTREFMQQARSHLNPGGVFVQWMAAEFMDEPLLRSLLATLADVFPQVRLYRTSPTTLLMMGSDAPIEPERHLATTQRVLDSSSLHYARIGLHAPEDLVAALALDDAGVRAAAGGQAPITDDDNRLATANPYSRGGGMTADRVAALLAPFDPLTHADSFVHREIAGQLDFAYIWRRVDFWSGDAGTGGLERLHALADALGDTPRAAQLRYMMAMRLKEPAIGRQLIDTAVMRWPDDSTLRYLAVEGELGALAQGGGSAEARANLRRLPDDALHVFAAMQAASSQQWDQVRALDAALSEIPWTAPWGLQAAQLRCEWRIRVKNAELRPQVGDEGIAIADRALNTQPDLFWYSLRAWSAVGTGRPDVELESIAGFAQTLQGIAAKLSGADLQIARSRAQSLQALLEELSRDPQSDPIRRTQVREKLDAALMGLNVKS